MKTRQDSVLAALQRAKPFIDDNFDQLSSAVDFTGARKRLDDIVVSFTAQAFDQNVNDRRVRAEVLKQRQLRDKLRTEQMRPIAEIARRNLRNVPEFKALLMPRQTSNGPAFIASANGMLNAATIHKDTLIERGLPADFLEQFQSAVAKLEASVSERQKSRTRRMGATKALIVEEQDGRSLLKVLDALVRRALQGNEALLGTWDGVRAIPQPRGATTTPPSTVASVSAGSTSNTPAAPTASGTTPTANAA
jgi:hypothetical protein